MFHARCSLSAARRSSIKRFTINSRKYDGSIRRSWECELVATADEYIDLVGVFEETVQHPDLGMIEKGTLSRERFYFRRWYNYFIFEYSAGTLRNYYINICMPPTIGDATVDYVDLDIDVIVWPDGRVVTVDVEEFESNASKYAYPEGIKAQARQSLLTVQLNPLGIVENREI